ncbi:MAG: S9 family peptidase [Candidatus Aminicenantes bacterium]|nr:S9 family peptidase [Candidatus Aminicenantes bacterium]
MKIRKASGKRTNFAALILLLSCALAAGATAKKELTFKDVMKFRQLRDPVVSADGAWLAYAAQPDRGDGEAFVQSVKEEKSFRVERGANPVFSPDSRWAGLVVTPPALDLEKAGKEKPRQGMALVRLADGEIFHAESVEQFAFSGDSAWLAYKLFPEEPKEEKNQAAVGEEKKGKKERGRTLVLRNLASGEEVRIAQALSFAFDESGAFLAYDRLGPEETDNGLYLRLLKKPGCPEKAVERAQGVRYSSLTWSEKDGHLAFVAAPLDDRDRTGPGSLLVWNAGRERLRTAADEKSVPDRWGIPEKNRLVWTEDGQRLFFGLKPVEYFDREPEAKDEEPADGSALFDFEKILAKSEVDVWHWNDPLINSHQKKLWPRIKERLFTAVFHQKTGKAVLLAGKDVPSVETVENPDRALGLSDVPYLKEKTWDGDYVDLFLVSLADGSRKSVAARIAVSYRSRPSLSPDGRYVAYYDRGHWFLHDGRLDKTVNLTSGLGVPFGDEDHDAPSEPPGYGLAGWLENDAAVLINDKFDVWIFPTSGGAPSTLTGGQGRAEGRIFRVLKTDPEARFFKKGETLLLSMFHEREKHHGFSSARIGRPGATRLLEDKKKFVFRAKAENADVVIYTRESFEEFPDLWAAEMTFTASRRLTDVNPQIREFAWGSAELVEWLSLDGRPLQGVLIKPAGYEEGKRYPVLVYFYEISSYRLYEYNQTVVNHRPCFPVYAGRGYCIFLPDVRYETGRPGLSALKCVLPGVQKLIDLGVADPKALGLHGHSWGGYETAFLVTQTDMFACAVAGAAVGNMTSAYSGIRWESGMARQMQYEKSQSRIGGSLWESPELYWANSPVFMADRIRTPLLLMHGDEDGAVPWYQSIEIYLAMRRLGKDCIFLQYRGEPHHPREYPNKLDYSIRMMEYLDHHLRGLPAPDWMTQGVAYKGR